MKSIIKNIKENYKLVVGVLVLGLFLGWLMSGGSGNVNTSEQGIENHEDHNHESADPQTWTCSMHPQIKQDKPGLCPICAMDLIPLKSMQSGGDDVDPNEIVMSESAAKLASIQTIRVEKGTPIKTINLQGKVQVDERNISELTARFGGRIEKLFVNYTGQQVRKGEKLASIYSPALLSAQKELLEAISFKESRPGLYTAAKGKLKLWDLTDTQIAAIEEKGEPQVYFNILSPITGTVSMRHVALGDYVKEGKALFKVVDLSKVWVMFDAYESDLPWIKLGDKVNFNLKSLPGKSYTAKVTYIDPFINGKTRVAKVRLEAKNKNGVLKPEMFVQGVLESKIAGNSSEIMVPKSAVLWTGKRSVVYVKIQDRESPSFLYREVVLGPEAGAYYVISEGLEEGEEIVTNGVFKIDAAAQLVGLRSMMNPDGGAAPVGHNHGDMGMDQSKHKIENFDVDVKFKKQLTAFYNEYLVLAKAFVTSNSSEVKKVSQTSLSKLGGIDMSLLKGDAHMSWMADLKILESKLKVIASKMDIDLQRAAFADFNLTFYKSVKSFGLNKVTTFYQFCPMANGDKGAYWLSNSADIQNPYFGDAMIGCGEVKETIK
ncbi:Cu(I)/Ag(I) efflux system membrane fusion protein [Ancylomarina subtilis]|uniref:Cu(I)/Ag(I) efflux system membrane fusion protein n=1 Tax=Ancylomarina subtilis TaxID=1639035 RepID=A0A4Q7V497_9BACT|nr:efflux RND transporter periplasmic adaptor subunit [Ancylomarina subtilis]RZT91306.1 Cu(I)/Ag(I) efflux system membrane fusion protein [Ancylomarina subtilis]